MRKILSLLSVVSLLLVLPVMAQVKVRATPHSVTLSWVPSTVPNGAPAVTSVTVYRATTAGAETLLQNIPLASLPVCPSGVPAGNTQCFVDTTVTAGTTYFYQITSSNSSGESAKSSEISVAVPNPVPPNAPTNLTGSSQ